MGARINLPQKTTGFTDKKNVEVGFKPNQARGIREYFRHQKTG